MTCCLLAADADIEADPEAYRCFRADRPDDPPCAVADALDQLYADDANRQAWQLFRQVATRFLSDAHAIPLALERLTADMDAETFADVVERLTVIYNVVCPPKEESRD